MKINAMDAENTEMLLPTIKKIDEISEDRYGL